MRSSRRSIHLFGGLLAFAIAALAGGPVHAEDILTLSYRITISGVYIGTVDIDARFSDAGYAIALTGAVGGVSRAVSDAGARMGAAGTIRSRQARPTYYEIEMREGDITAEAEMHLDGRNVTDLYVLPGLVPAFDRISLTIDDVRGVVDPLSAMFVPSAGLSGQQACNRTLPVFDGWQRFDVVLSYQTTRTVIGDREAYAGPVHICNARYVPVAGHRPTHAPVAYLSQNERLEAWLMPAAGVDILIPYQLLIGTELGDLLIQIDRMAFRSE